MNLPATISSVQVTVLSHKNVVASEASNSRLVILVGFGIMVKVKIALFIMDDINHRAKKYL